MSSVIEQFLQACLYALVRAEVADRVPQRFIGEGPAIWRAFRNELTLADLLVLAIEDSGAVMPVPFRPKAWWPEWPDWALQNQDEALVQKWLENALKEAESSQIAYLHTQAEILGLSLPEGVLLNRVTTPESFERWLELPGSGGWFAYSLCTRTDAALYYWENFQIVCNTPQEMLFAGLIAWELGAPPNQALPIRLDDLNLTKTLQSDKPYDGVVGLKKYHGHRNFDVLQREKGSTWLL